MFGLWSAKCALEPCEQAWVERRMQWLVERIGWSALDAVEVVVPEAVDLPTSASGDDGIEHVFDQVCRWMGVAPDSIRLALFDAEAAPHVNGLYEAPKRKADRPTIYVARELLADCEVLIAVCAHELAHHRLLGDGLQSGHEPDMEHVTDLLPVVLGLGVFAANAVLREYAETIGQWFHWGARKSGYLPTRLLGYALALFAHVRGERRPTWQSALRPDARGALRNGLKYLDKAPHPQFGPGAKSASIEDLDDDCPARRVSAMWEFGNDRPRLVRAAKQIAKNLRHGERDVRVVAASLLAHVPEVAETVLDDLLNALDDPVPEVRRAVLATIRECPVPAEACVPELLMCFDRHPQTTLDTSLALAAFGEAAAPGFQRISQLLVRLLPMADEFEESAEQVVLLADACRQIDPGEYEGWLRFAVEDAHVEVRANLNRALRGLSKKRPKLPPPEPVAAVPWISHGWYDGAGTLG